MELKAEEIYTGFERVLEFMEIGRKEIWMRVLDNDFGHPEDITLRTANSMVTTLTDYISNVKHALHLEKNDIFELKKLLYKSVRKSYQDFLTLED